MYIFQCENSIDGILTGIYNAFESHYGHKNIQLSVNCSGNYILFEEYITVTPDFHKSQKVSQTLITKFGTEFYETICKSAMADGGSRKLTMDKANAIYRTIVMALALPAGAKVLHYLAEPCIQCIFELCRQTHNEGHHYLGFLRFSELEGGILFAEIHPKNHILPILADHFVDRLPGENFIIYDATHQIAAVHQSYKDYLTVDASSLNLDITKRHSKEELEYRKLWCTFFDSIAIDARINPKLQSGNMPKRFWKDAIEFRSKEVLADEFK